MLVLSREWKESKKLWEESYKLWGESDKLLKGSKKLSDAGYKLLKESRSHYREAVYDYFGSNARINWVSGEITSKERTAVPMGELL